MNFAGTAGTTYFILAGGAGGATGNLVIVATVSGTGLTIVPTFDSTITNDPQATTIESTINAAIALYQNSFSDPVTVTVTFGEMGSGLGINFTTLRLSVTRTIAPLWHLTQRPPTTQWPWLIFQIPQTIL